MKVWIEVEVTEEVRRGIRYENGGTGLATRQELKDALLPLLIGDMEDLGMTAEEVRARRRDDRGWGARQRGSSSGAGDI